MTDLVIYHNDMSSCAQKVRFVLAEKGLAFDGRHLDLRAAIIAHGTILRFTHPFPAGMVHC
jgi:glutathione S-transferase